MLTSIFQAHYRREFTLTKIMQFFFFGGGEGGGGGGGGQTRCIMGNAQMENRPFAGSHSRGTKPPYW